MNKLTLQLIKLIPEDDGPPTAPPAGNASPADLAGRDTGPAFNIPPGSLGPTPRPGFGLATPWGWYKYLPKSGIKKRKKCVWRDGKCVKVTGHTKGESMNKAQELLGLLEVKRFPLRKPDKDEKEELLYSVKDYQDDKGNLPKWWANSKVGDTTRIPHGAPGVGYSEYKITKIDSAGIWAKYIGGTGGELEPGDVV